MFGLQLKGVIVGLVLGFVIRHYLQGRARAGQ